MEIYVSRDGEQWGPYDEDQLAEHLRSGAISVEDLAWTEGVADWQPLRDLIGEEAAAAYQAVRSEGGAGKPRLVTGNAAPGFAIEGFRPAGRPAVGGYGTPAVRGTVPVRPGYAVAGLVPAYGGLPVVERPRYAGFAWAAWIVMGVCCVIAIIPIFGFLMWYGVWFAAILAFVFGGIVISRGGTVQGIMIIVAGVFTICFGLIAPVVSAVVFMLSQVDLEEAARRQQGKPPAQLVPAVPGKPAGERELPKPPDDTTPERPR